MMHVAAALNISRPALYYYFDNKEKILASLVDAVSVYSENLARSVADVKTDPVEALYEMVFNHAMFVLQNPVIFRVVERSEDDLDPEAKELNKRAKRALLDRFSAIIQRGIKKGKFRAADPSIGALTIIGMCSWSAWWFRGNGRLTDHQVASQMAEMAVASLLRHDMIAAPDDFVREAIVDLQCAIERVQAAMTRTNSRAE
jgi:AcrR family transcriptional regulator